MKRSLALLAATGIVALTPSCSSGFGHISSQAHLTVAITGGDVGAPDKRLPISFSPSSPVKVRIEAHTPNGDLDTSYQGWVRISVRPGTVFASNDGSGGRNVQLRDGVATDVAVPLVASYGDAHIWAEDLGFVPVSDLKRTPPPQCSDGIDNDGDGKIDAAADDGCFAANDDSETGGTYATGVSGKIFYALPRIADVRGIALNSGGATAFPGEQVSMATGWNEAANRFDYDVVVTRIASDGFYVTDVSDQALRGFASVFAFTFSAPTKLRVCDRMKVFAGTASDFYGFTEIGFPTWSVEYYDPNARPCLVPEPYVFSVADLANTKALFKVESAMVRVLSTGTVSAHIGAHIGAGFPAAPNYTPTADASNCDLNQSGKVEFGNPAEAACATACQADVECSEFSSFLGQSNFNLVVTDSASNATAKIQANGSAAPGFDAVILKGKPIKSFTGTLRYFSGGSQFTVEARCGDDIVTDLNAQPMSSNSACVRPRTDLELSQGN